MDVVEKIQQTMEPSLEAMGYAVVLIRLSEHSGRKTLSVMVERTDGKNMTVEDCTEISRTAGALLDVEDPITGAYDLEVCSPGIDRPLTRLTDFTRYAGHEVKLETQVPIGGRKRFRGMLKAPQGDMIKIAMPEGEVDVSFKNIRAAKLVLTDALVASYLKKQNQKDNQEV